MSNNAGFVSLAHFRTDWISFTKPVSFGFSRPLRRRFFITATNSRLLSWPSTATKRQIRQAAWFYLLHEIFTSQFRSVLTYDFHQRWWTPHLSHGHQAQHGQQFLQHASELLKQYNYCKYYQIHSWYFPTNWYLPWSMEAPAMW